MTNLAESKIAETLAAAGYRRHGRTAKGSLDPILHQKVVDAPPCHCNDKTFINVYIHDPIDIQGVEHEGSVSIEICGNADGERWVDFQYYGLKAHDLIEPGVLETLEGRLIEAWKAVHRVDEIHPDREK
jgi:hypothetical protein